MAPRSTMVRSSRSRWTLWKMRSARWLLPPSQRYQAAPLRSGTRTIARIVMMSLLRPFQRLGLGRFEAAGLGEVGLVGGVAGSEGRIIGEVIDPDSLVVQAHQLHVPVQLQARDLV